MSVFYKFKSAKDYDTIACEGTGISLGKLKQAILTQSKLTKTMDYDLVVQNAQSGEVYKYDQDVVPKNTSLLVKRVPLNKGGLGSANNNPSANAQPAVVPPNLSSINTPSSSTGNTKSLTGSLLSRNTTTSSTMSSTGQPSFSSLFPTLGNVSGEQPKEFNEEEKLKEVLSGMSEKWIPETSTQHHHSHSKTRGGVPPPNYICHRCKKPGHYIQNCPTNGDPRYDIKTIRRATGIPKSFLTPVETPQVDLLGGSVVTLGGNLAVVSSNDQMFAKAIGKRSNISELKDIPKEFQCPLCSKLFNDAVTIPCCKTNYCNNCITHALIHNNLTCPNCQSPEQSIDSLAPNYELRNKVEKFKLTLDPDLAKATDTKETFGTPSTTGNVPARGNAPVHKRHPHQQQHQQQQQHAPRNNYQPSSSAQQPPQQQHYSGGDNKQNQSSNISRGYPVENRQGKSSPQRDNYDRRGNAPSQAPYSSYNRNASYDSYDNRRDGRREDRRDERRDDRDYRRGGDYHKRDRYEGRKDYGDYNGYDRKKRKD
ncbi:hypothetical protein C9374_009836 [Naegleria lovaniensis]|uniref:Uncharacterized protein n=1 Tax=Naegleria lovaniensis TaxID=51637 RepID=A0AA88KEP3_NAELO|nr:uncharacterized protein C9374_011887 [Naegleria lovaniensis]XP_044544387.1 uncharacterized protein C9374_009836 [Naegleria lovaniensis]KAG2373598.1 hypothetical protein C9374_011887 [Naegleria lovaniensis]KAG2375213.1 hypothetical protein C9374_009836 [Naegleria lovaniensis]